MELGKTKSQITAWLKERQNLPDSMAFIILSGLLILGIFLADDYGIHWDEHSQYNHGLVTAQYINELCGGCISDKPLSDVHLIEYKDRTHGVIFQMVALGIQTLLGIHDIRQILLLRHYLTFFIFWISLVFFYRLLKKYLNDKYLAITGLLFFILSPRIFAESFYNSKDIVFLSLTIFCTWTLLGFLDRPSFKSAFMHALTSALLIATRVTGIFMPVATIFLIAIKLLLMEPGVFQFFNKYFRQKHPGFLRRSLIWPIAYLALASLLLVAFWPYLWQNPLNHFREIFTSMSHFPWDDPVLFAGNFLNPKALPFYYVQVWMAITTPLLYSVLFLAGLIVIPLGRKSSADRFYDLVPVVLFFFPLLAVILLHSVLYDGWRQVYFLYIPFMMIALRGFQGLFQLLTVRSRKNSFLWLYRILFLCAAASCIDNVIFIARYHPDEQVYFNFLAGKEPVRDFEGDYWGLSYREDLEYILQSDPSDTLKICAVNWPVKANADAFPPEQRKRLKFTDIDEAKYFISNYRFPIEHDKFAGREYPYDSPLYEVKVKNYIISGVYGLNR
jgi:hypothetical protein